MRANRKHQFRVRRIDMRPALRLSLLTSLILVVGSSAFFSRHPTRAHKIDRNQPAVASCTVAPPGMVSWWPGEGNANDIRGENNGVLNGATIAAGEVGQAFSFNGSSEVTVVDNGNLNLQT